MESIGFLINDIINIIKHNPKNINKIVASGGAAEAHCYILFQYNKQHIICPEMKDKTAF